MKAQSEKEKARIEAEIHRMVVSRDRKYTSFIEVRLQVVLDPPPHHAPHNTVDLLRVQFGSYKLVYRRYAGLFFTIAVDINDNELVYLETIHLFVELLDKYFSNVCELDIVFNFNKVRAHPSSLLSACLPACHILLNEPPCPRHHSHIKIKKGVWYSRRIHPCRGDSGDEQGGNFREDTRIGKAGEGLIMGLIFKDSGGLRCC